MAKWERRRNNVGGVVRDYSGLIALTEVSCEWFRGEKRNGKRGRRERREERAKTPSVISGVPYRSFLERKDNEHCANSS